MTTKLNWTRNILSGIYSLYSDNQQIGTLKGTVFSQNGTGSLNGKEILFKTKGFFKQETEIYDTNGNKLLGSIVFNAWMTKATLSIYGKELTWKSDNIWNSKWRIFDAEDLKINYSGSPTKGSIESNTTDEILLLAGLFASNFLNQITIAVAVASFIPIYFSIFN